MVMAVAGFYFFILWVLCGSTYGESPITNDDILRRFELLEQKVDRQANIIRKQSNEIKELKRSVKSGSAEIGVAQQKRFVMNDGESVAFHARIDKAEIAHIGITQKLIFDITVLNNGNSYHNSTGVFVAPAAGLYFFSMSVCILHPGKDIHAEIMKNGISIAGSYAYGYDQGSVSTIIPLDVNDEVWVSSLHHPDTYLWGGSLTSFMGFKILDY